MTTPKEAYDARQKLKRIARGDEPDAKSDEALVHDMLFDLAERFVRAVEGIETALRTPRDNRDRGKSVYGPHWRV